MKIYKIMSAVLVCTLIILLGAGIVLANQTQPSETNLESIKCDSSDCNLEFNDDVEIAKVLKTGSMKPTFDDDTLIMVQAKKISIGDIIVYENGNEFIVHRVIDIKIVEDQLFYKTKGDNNIFADQWVPFEAIKWKVVGILY